MSSGDHMENVIGGFGKYQTWILILISIGRLPTDFQLNIVVFLLPDTDFQCLDDGIQNRTNHCPCENIEFDRDSIVESVTTEWNLVCDRKNLASLAQSIMQVGILVGSLFYGFVSDRSFSYSCEKFCYGIFLNVCTSGWIYCSFFVNVGIEWISILIFSILAFTSAAMCCLLPETRHKVILNTIEQTEQSNTQSQMTEDKMVS